MNVDIFSHISKSCIFWWFFTIMYYYRDLCIILNKRDGLGGLGFSSLFFFFNRLYWFILYNFSIFRLYSASLYMQLWWRDLSSIWGTGPELGLPEMYFQAELWPAVQLQENYFISAYPIFPFALHLSCIFEIFWGKDGLCSTCGCITVLHRAILRYYIAK